MRHCALLLTVIFSRGEQMPVHYFNQLGDAFVHYLLENIENPATREHEREICDVFIGLVLSYNMQFKDKSSNVTVKCLTKRNSAKAFTEQVNYLSYLVTRVSGLWTSLVWPLQKLSFILKLNKSALPSKPPFTLVPLSLG